MKATTKILCALFALSISLITFTSCDDNISDVSILQGTWMHQDNDSRDYIQFLANGTGYEWEEPLTSIPGFEPRKEKFQYSVSGNQITFVEADGDIDVETIKLKDDNHIKIDGDTYTRQ